MGGAKVADGRGVGIAAPMLRERCCGGPGRGRLRLFSDHRAGATAELSLKPSSNRLGHPSSVCLQRKSAYDAGPGQNERRHSPPKRVPPSEAVPAEGAPVVAGFEMDAIVVTIQVRLSLELFGAGLAADHGCAWMRVLALRVVSLHVRFPIVASLEELAADPALVGCFLGSGPLALLLDAVDAGETGASRFGS